MTQIFHRRSQKRSSSSLVVAVAAALQIAACGDSPTSPTTTTTTTTPTVAAPTTTETWDGTVPVGGSSFYSFSIAENGTVNLTLLAVSGALVPSGVWLGLGIGTPSGTECVTTSSVSTQAGTLVQLTGTFAPGVACAKVYDIGNLFGPASFTMRIEHS